MRRKGRNHSAAFKAKVALAAARGDKTLSEIAEHYDVHPNQVQDWRRKLVENAEHLFEQGAGRENDTEHELKEPHAKIGQLTSPRGESTGRLSRWFSQVRMSAFPNQVSNRQSFLPILAVLHTRP